MDPNQILDVATSSAAQDIGLPTAHKQYNDRLRVAHAEGAVVTTNMTQDQFIYLQSRTTGALVFQPQFNRGGDHPLLYAARQLGDGYHNATNMKQVTVKTGPGTEMTVWRLKIPVPTLVCCATEADVKKYAHEPNIHFWFSDVDPKDVHRNSDILLKAYGHYATHGDRIKAGLPDIKHRIHVNEFPYDNKYTQLYFHDCMYNFTEEDIHNMMSRTGALRLVGTGWYPPQLIYEDTLEPEDYRFKYEELDHKHLGVAPDPLYDQLYKAYQVANRELEPYVLEYGKVLISEEGVHAFKCFLDDPSSETRDDGRELALAKVTAIYQELMPYLSDVYEPSQTEKIRTLEVVGWILNGNGNMPRVLDTGRLRPKHSVRIIGLHGSEQECVESLGHVWRTSWLWRSTPPSGVGGWRKWARGFSRTKRMDKLARAKMLKQMVTTANSRMLTVYFKHAAGAKSHGYSHPICTWSIPLKPGFNVMDGKDQVTSYLCEIAFQSNHFMYFEMFKTHSPGIVKGQYSLPLVDARYKVLNLDRTVKRWGIFKGSVHLSKLDYDVIPQALVDKTLNYYASLNDGTGKDQVSAISNLVNYLRSENSKITIVNQQTQVANPFIRQDLLQNLATVIWLHGKRLDLNYKAALAEIDKPESWIRKMFYRVTDGTLVERFFRWLHDSRTTDKLIISGRMCEDFDVELFAGDQQTFAPVAVDYDPEYQDVLPEVNPDSSIHAQLDMNCLVCRGLHGSKYPLDACTVHHGPKKVRFQLSPEDIADLDDKLMSDLQSSKMYDEAPDTLSDLKEAVKKRKEGITQVDVTVDVEFARGMPGTGKTTVLLAIIEMLYTQGVPNVGIAVPFKKLRSTFMNAKRPNGGKYRKGFIKFKTFHRAIIDLAGCPYIIIDEVGAMPMEFIALLAHFNPGATFIIVGDDNQTQTRDKIEGINFFNRLRNDGYDIDKMSMHILRANYRNPTEAVNAANLLLPPHCQMVSKSGRSSPVEVYRNEVMEEEKMFRSKYAKIGEDSDWTVMTFSKPDSSLWDKACTVRSSQGSTYKRVLLVIRPSCENLFLMNAMQLVAYTRHTDQLVIYVCAPSGMYTTLFHNYGFLFPAIASFDKPITGFVEKKAEPVKPAEIVTKYLPPMDSHLVQVDGDKAIEQKIEESMYQNGTLPSVKKLQLTVDHLHDMTSAGMIKDMKKTVYKFRESDSSVAQDRSCRMAQRTMHNRVAVSKPSKKLEDDELRYVDTKLDQLFNRMLPVKMTPELFWQTSSEWIADGEPRHYPERFASHNDPHMIETYDYMCKTWTARAADAGFDVGEFFTQRVGVKPQLKVLNIGKKASRAEQLKKVGQAIASIEISVVCKYGIIFRILTKLLQQALPADGTFRVAINQGVTEGEMEERTLKDVADLFLAGCAKIGYFDGEETDSGAEQGSQQICDRFTTRFAVKTEFNLWFPDFRYSKYMLIFVKNKVLTDGAKASSGRKTPSGASDTYWRTLIACMIGAHLRTKVSGPQAWYHGGDDGRVIATNVERDPKGAEIWQRACNIKITYVETSGVGLSEFCGQLCAIIPGKVLVSQHLVRKFIKVFDAEYQNGDHFGECMVSLRSWLEGYMHAGREDRRMDLLWTAAILICKQEGVDPLRHLQVGMDIAQGMFDALVCLSRCKAKDFVTFLATKIDKRSVNVGKDGHQL